MKLLTLVNKNIIALVAPELGGNICRVTAFGYNVIDYETELLENFVYTGTPILYPTPNRVVNAEIMWYNERIKLQKRNRRYDCHGIVFDESWKYEKINESTLKLWIDFEKGTEIYKAFPFEHRLTLVYSLDGNSLNIIYHVENYGTKEIPFGFGIHPYFQKLCDNIDIKINAKNVMETGELFFIPTGFVTSANKTKDKLNVNTDLKNVNEDYVFIDIADENSFEINFKDIELKVISKVTNDFNHVVTYIPKEEKFFCIENQTSSANCHALYSEGYQMQSGLILTPLGKTYSGKVEIFFELST